MLLALHFLFLVSINKIMINTNNIIVNYMYVYSYYIIMQQYVTHSYSHIQSRITFVALVKCYLLVNGQIVYMD